MAVHSGVSTNDRRKRKHHAYHAEKTCLTYQRSHCHGNNPKTSRAAAGAVENCFQVQKKHARSQRA